MDRRALVGALLVSLAVGCAGKKAVRTGEDRLRLEPGHAPYLGVRCTKANSIACDTVGLAVWLKQPARNVSATVAGHPVTLRVASGAAAHFEGSLYVPGLLHRGPAACRLGLMPPQTSRAAQARTASLS